ncbi:MAG: tetratricopeptide repeat protein [Ruminococcaceae bacterium]|nr:tetratricopeptide repeat protein [Oscillospiraceae bacterium]
MFQLYKDLKIWYWVLIVIIAIPIAVYGAISEKIEFILLAMIVPFFVVIGVCIVASKRIQELNKIRENNCNIAQYYTALNELRLNCKNAKNLNILNMNIAVAFLDMGRYSDAFNILMGINPITFGKGAFGVKGRGVYYNNLSYAYIGLGDLESAEKVLVNLKQCIDDPKLQKMEKEKNLLFDIYTSKKVILQIETGDFEGAEQILLMLLEKSRSNLWQVCTSYYLARVYLHKGDTEKAKRYIDFAMQYGGDTVYKSELAKMIQQN